MKNVSDSSSSPVSPAISLLSGKAVLQRSKDVLVQARSGDLASLSIDESAIAGTVQLVRREIEATYPDYQLPPWSYWRRLETGGHDRWGMLAGAREFETADAMIRSAADLVVLIAVARQNFRQGWSFEEALSGGRFDGADGTALAVFGMFAAGAFSSAPADPLRADAHALVRMEPEEIAAGFQMEQTADETQLLHLATMFKRLGEVMAMRPDLFEHEGETRPGSLLARIAAENRDQTVSSGLLVERYLEGLTAIWDGGAVLDDVILGDVWAHDGICRTSTPKAFMPFHLPVLEIVHSLVEPLAWAGYMTSDLDRLPGLASLEHCALFIATGVIRLNEDDNVAPLHAAIELRAVTLGLLEEIADRLRSELEVDADTLPLICIQQGGTVAAGSKIAMENPAVWEKASKILSAGGVFWLPFGA